MSVWETFKCILCSWSCPATSDGIDKVEEHLAAEHGIDV